MQCFQLMLKFVDQCLRTRLLDILIEFMYSINEKKIFKKYLFIKRGNKIFWVAAILLIRSERGNKQNFILGLRYLVFRVVNTRK
jgi:hypothetical protein